MPETKEPPALQQTELELEQAATFCRFYCNNAQIEVTPWDFRLIFGELKKAEGKLKVEQSVAVVMSPQHAKALLGILASNLREYEAKVGKIDLPAGILQEPTEPDKPATAEKAQTKH
jgi:hypothetical protein